LGPNKIDRIVRNRVVAAATKLDSNAPDVLGKVDRVAGDDVIPSGVNRNRDTG
jgi:hypothetical protein